MTESNLPGTPREKYEAMKAQLIKKGRWNASQDSVLRTSLGLPATDVAAEVKPAAKPAKPAKKVSKGRVAPAKSKSKK